MFFVDPRGLERRSSGSPHRNEVEVWGCEPRPVSQTLVVNMEMPLWCRASLAKTECGWPSGSLGMVLLLSITVIHKHTPRDSGVC